MAKNLRNIFFLLFCFLVLQPQIAYANNDENIEKLIYETNKSNVATAKETIECVNNLSYLEQLFKEATRITKNISKQVKSYKEEKTLPQNLVVLENKERYDDIVQEIINLTNLERVKYGLEELIYSEELMDIAMERAIEGACNEVFSHTRPNGEDFLTLYQINNVSFEVCGENLARYQLTPLEVVEDWMASPTHKDNILYGYTHIGIGVAKDDFGNYYFVQEFKK